MLVFAIEQILLPMSSTEVAGENLKENGYKESCSSVDYYFSKKLSFVRKRLNKLREENLTGSSLVLSSELDGKKVEKNTHHVLDSSVIRPFLRVTCF